MDRIVFITTLLFSFNTFALELKSNVKSLKLKKFKNYYISENCKNCLAKNFYKKSNLEKLQKLIDSQKKSQVAVGVKVCEALETQIWVLEDAKEIEYAVCEFNDGSATLASDIAKFYNALLDK